MIPDFQTLMRPVLEAASHGEVKLSEVVNDLASRFELTNEEISELLPSGKQARFANRVHWARSYLKQAGLLSGAKRGFMEITDSGRKALQDKAAKIDSKYLGQFPTFQEFSGRVSEKLVGEVEDESNAFEKTPDEQIRRIHEQINTALANEIVERLRVSEPAFFESVIVQLLMAMGYGKGKDAGQLLGKSGDDGVDGVINQDPLGVDRVFFQAKRYAADNRVGPDPIRGFSGALDFKGVEKGIFVTTSDFTKSAEKMAQGGKKRIVLINGFQLAQLMIAHEVGCRVTEIYRVSELDESFFE